MCRLCDAAAASAAYGRLLDSMGQQDLARLERTKALAGEMKILQRTCCSSMKWPVKLQKPMFEARTAFAVPHNYYQNLFLDGEKMGMQFAHGAMRSLFFAGDAARADARSIPVARFASRGERLVVLSKTVDVRGGEEFLTSFVLLHLEPGEYSAEAKGESVSISADAEKPMRNLVTGTMERRKVKFAFTGMPVANHIVSREQVMSSAQFRKVYERFGGAEAKSASMDMEGYAVTVPHFAPHPYLLQLKGDFGYASNRQFQESVAKDYFLQHVRV